LLPFHITETEFQEIVGCEGSESFSLLIGFSNHKNKYLGISAENAENNLKNMEPRPKMMIGNYDDDEV
jgi:hypothetical protein